MFAVTGGPIYTVLKHSRRFHIRRRHHKWAKEQPNAGLGMATFLLGEPTYFDHGGIIQFPDERATRISGYAGDTWRATRKITLNFGGRWDYISPITPKKAGGDANFNLNTGEILIAGVGDVSKYSDVEPRYTNFAPRLGATYAITEKTVIRAGLGRSYFINGFDAAFNHLDTFYPVAQNQTLSQTPHILGSLLSRTLARRCRPSARTRCQKAVIWP